MNQSSIHRSQLIVTTVPFGGVDRTPLDMLEKAGIGVAFNPLGRKLKADEVRDVIAGFSVVVAGTETIDGKTMERCPDLKAICRVGIGLDSVDLLAAQRLGIAVSYTPDAPSPAVAELTVGLILNLLRGVSAADHDLHQGRWSRITGSRVAISTIGVIGVGRIGRRVINHLRGGFPGLRIIANEISPDTTIEGVEWVDQETLFRQSDVVTLHVPLTVDTVNLIAMRELSMMKPSSVLVNTARGGIVHEGDLFHALKQGVIRAAACDVFSEEPYVGELAALPNALLTCHMGSMTADCRAQMEIEATAEAVRFLTGARFHTPVPEQEYVNAARNAKS